MGKIQSKESIFQSIFYFYQAQNEKKPACSNESGKSFQKIIIFEAKKNVTYI